MLFNEPIFIFLFLPITWLLVLISRGIGTKYILISASLFFYAYWNPKLIFLLISSIIFNYFLSKHFINGTRGKLSLIAGISLNLFTLGYFKYKNFFLSNICSLFECSYTFETLILPLGISFFTFQQISFLLDRYNNLEKHPAFVDFFLFISFFPQLVAGPIVGSRQFLPQINGRAVWIYQDYMWRGLTLFNIGLFKKIVIADQLAQNVLPVFKMAETSAVSFTDAWIGTLSFTFQIYFDFSAYSDMAIGLALLFGIILPINFNSPYKAFNIIDFWRRWHITLSKFLRDYVYIAIGGNRYGTIIRYRNIMITMLIGGIWHGAGWTFLIWGGLHGIFILLNHSWRFVTNNKFNNIVFRLFAWILTFSSVAIAWVPFRANDMNATLNMYKSMFSKEGFIEPLTAVKVSDLHLIEALNYTGNTLLASKIDEIPSYWGLGVISIAVLSLTCLIMPNSTQITAYFEKNYSKSLVAATYAIIISCYFSLSLLVMLFAQGKSEFLYFDF